MVVGAVYCPYLVASSLVEAVVAVVVPIVEPLVVASLVGVVGAYCPLALAYRGASFVAVRPSYLAVVAA